ncbi:sulfite exporter TauE/SafE family protein [Falsibacillus albus]|uniref:Probable membrane transporter protein n=1 Tax=Falsibacillus albus TaxID=2478915 RepID=A0A3L7K1N9_9BACI|nr:sulfite exporter TauE/SafE family protein [Falsibacillus albus]RLQ95891.1 sulfite exporter TauE/SafE family protein [Falsibacillus albus]
MKKLLILAFIGLMAQLIDGSLGMAYGLTSTSLLLAFGMAPAVVSASVHLAEVVTTAVSGVSHIKFGNVDKNVVRQLIFPGSVGAFLGACLLSRLPGELVKPYISIFLLLLGIYIIMRFLLDHSKQGRTESKPYTKKQLIPLGFFAGLLDATGGGGWGPVATPILLAKKGADSRKVIGSVDTSEFAIASSATLGFILSLGWESVNWTWVIALMAGGIVAAPIAAWLVRIIPSHIMGILVGGLIIMTNAHTLLTAGNSLSGTTIQTVNIILFFVWGIAFIHMLRKRKKANKRTLNA